MSQAQISQNPLALQQATQQPVERAPYVFFKGSFEEKDVLLPDGSTFYYENGDDVYTLQMPRMGRSNRSFEGDYGVVVIQGFSSNLLGTHKYQETKHKTKDITKFDAAAIDSIKKFVALAPHQGKHKGHLIYTDPNTLEEQSVEALLSVDVRMAESGKIANVVVSLSSPMDVEITPDVLDFLANVEF